MARVSSSKIDSKLKELAGNDPAPDSRVPKQPADRLRMFLKITSAIASELNLEKILHAILNEIFDFYDPRGCSIMLLQGDQLHLLAARNEANHQINHEALPRFKLGEGIAGTAALTGKPMWLDDTQGDPRFAHSVGGKKSKIRAVLAVPMKLRGRVTGILNVTYTQPHKFSFEEVGILEIIASQAASAIQNSILYSKLEDERSKLQIIQDSMEGGLTVTDPDGAILFYNRAIKETYDIKNDISGKSFNHIIANYSNYFRYKIVPHFEVKEVAALLLKKGSAKIMFEVQSPKQRFIEVLVTPLKNKDGTAYAYISNHRDVTDLLQRSQQYQGQLVEAESERERWKAIFDNVDESIVILDRNGIIIQANPASEILSGKGPRELVGKKFEEMFVLTNERGLLLTGDLSPIKTVKTTKEGIDYLQAKFINTEGREVWVGASFTPIQAQDSDSTNDQIVVVLRDISRLIEIDRAKTDFVSMASHELRTPLTVINGYISLFTSGDLGDLDKPEMANYKQVFAQIKKNTERLTNLVEDLLNVSRIEQGRMSLNLERVNLESLVKELVEEMQISATAKHQSLKFTNGMRGFLDFPTIVNADYERIKQVLINLIGNAIKYTPDGGSITVGIKKYSSEVIVTVRDNGPGVPKQLIPRIFEKFQRLEGSYVKDTVGTGLGLYIVREIIKMHGGRVWVDSEVGKGSSFSFSLPL